MPSPTPPRGDQQAAEGRPGHRSRLKHDGIQADGVRQMLARNERRHQSLPRRQVECRRPPHRGPPAHRSATRASRRRTPEPPGRAARSPSRLCVNIISRRRFQASATTPLSIEKRMIGTTLTRPTMPSASPLRAGGTSSETCHRRAAFCMVDPVIDASRPSQIRR